MRAPDKQNRFGNGTEWAAWHVVPREGSPARATTVRSWLLHCPGAHLAWSYWLVSVVHLRPVEGMPDAKKHYPESEHELLSVALAPDYVPDPDAPADFRHMTPVDFAHQFHGVTDEQARDMLDRFVDLVVAGRLSPDTDYARAWKDLLWGTIEHFTTGHPQGSA